MSRRISEAAKGIVRAGKRFFVTPTSAFETGQTRLPQYRLASSHRQRRMCGGQAGSNRRPLACHASALPAELWPQYLRRTGWGVAQQTKITYQEYPSLLSLTFFVARDVADDVGDVPIAFFLSAVKGRIYRLHRHRWCHRLQYRPRIPARQPSCRYSPWRRLPPARPLFVLGGFRSLRRSRRCSCAMRLHPRGAAAAQSEQSARPAPRPCR